MLILIEPQYTERTYAWCERTVIKIINYLLLDCVFDFTESISKYNYFFIKQYTLIMLRKSLKGITSSQYMKNKVTNLFVELCY